MDIAIMIYPAVQIDPSRPQTSTKVNFLCNDDVELVLDRFDFSALLLQKFEVIKDLRYLIFPSRIAQALQHKIEKFEIWYFFSPPSLQRLQHAFQFSILQRKE
jgi:hypothetical protein